MKSSIEQIDTEPTPKLKPRSYTAYPSNIKKLL